MPEQNVAVVKGAYAAFGRGDIPGVVAALDPKIEWSLPESLPFGGTYKGKEGAMTFFGKLPQYFQELKVEPTEYTASGDLVVVRGQHKGKAKGGPFVIPFAMFWTLKSGKAVRFQEWQDTVATRKALGL